MAVSKLAVGDVVRRADERVGVVSGIANGQGRDGVEKSVIMVDYGGGFSTETPASRLEFVANGPVKWTKGKAWTFILMTVFSFVLWTWVVVGMYTGGYHDVLILAFVWASMQLSATGANLKFVRPAKTRVR